MFYYAPAMGRVKWGSVVRCAWQGPASFSVAFKRHNPAIARIGVRFFFVHLAFSERFGNVWKANEPPFILLTLKGVTITERRHSRIPFHITAIGISLARDGGLPS